MAAAGELGGLALLVNNASALGAEPLVRPPDHPLDGPRVALEVNAVAPLGLLQEVLPLLRSSSYLASYEEVTPYTGNRSYAADVGNGQTYDSNPCTENARNAGSSDSSPYIGIGYVVIEENAAAAGAGGAAGADAPDGASTR